jgi:mycofactocin system FadH/OYE family oxidoreductase 1
MFGPHETNLGRKRSVSDRHVAYYRRRAAGGAGVIVIEEASVHPSDWPYERSPLAADSADGWAAVARACHDEGALVIAALGHAGGQGSSAYSQGPLWAPSRVPEVASREVPKWMEQADVEAMIAGFAAAAQLAKQAGLDGVEINAGQHSLVRQFLSGLTNQRSDEWGADRLLFARRILEAVRAGMGLPAGAGTSTSAQTTRPQAPAAMGGAAVGLRLSCDELAPWAGIVAEDAPAIAAAFAPLIDWVTVVRGSIFTASATRPTGHVDPGFNLSLAATVRAALPPRVAVVAQGSLVDLDQVEQAVSSGVADAGEMTRAQIADPDLVVKLAAGQRGRVRPCILCNQTCQVRDVRNPIITCVGEPSSGHELDEPDPLPWRDPSSPASPASPASPDSPATPGGPLDLLVVGGGPAGLECARVAALRGHRVRLVESSQRTGGMLRVAARGAGRQRLALLADWLESECLLAGVDIVTGRRAEPNDLAEHAGPVILATGSLPGRQTYAVDESAIVITAADLLAGIAPGEGEGAGAGVGVGVGALPHGPVVVWDPIGGPIAVSVAELLGVAGPDGPDDGASRRVHLVTPDLIPGNELSRSGDLASANTRLQALGVSIERRSILRRVLPGAAQVEDRFTGDVRSIEAVAVIDAGHRLPDDRLWMTGGGRWARVGDAVAPRSVHEAVLEARRAALALDSWRPKAPAVMRADAR